MLPTAGHLTVLSGWRHLLPSEGTGTLLRRGTGVLLRASLIWIASLRRMGTEAEGTGTPPGEQLPRAQRSMTRRAGRQLRRRRVSQTLSGTARQGRRCQPCVTGCFVELSEMTCWLQTQAVLALLPRQQLQGRGACLLFTLHACLLHVGTLAHWHACHVNRSGQAQQGRKTGQCAAQSCSYNPCRPIRTCRTCHSGFHMSIHMHDDNGHADPCWVLRAWSCQLWLLRCA